MALGGRRQALEPLVAVVWWGWSGERSSSLWQPQVENASLGRAAVGGREREREEEKHEWKLGFVTGVGGF